MAGAVTVTAAVPFTALLVARTDAVPVPEAGAVYKPVVLTVPMPEAIAQV